MINRLIEEADITAVYFPRKKMPADGFDAEGAQTTKENGRISWRYLSYSTSRRHHICIAFDGSWSLRLASFFLVDRSPITHRGFRCARFVKWVGTYPPKVFIIISLAGTRIK